MTTFEQLQALVAMQRAVESLSVQRQTQEEIDFQRDRDDERWEDWTR